GHTSVISRSRHEAGPGPVEPGRNGSRRHLPASRWPVHSTTGRPIMMKTILKGAPLALAFAFATPAFAGTCPTPGSMDLKNAPTMPEGVTDTVIGAIQLGGEINVEGRQLRTRRLV